MVSLGTNIPYRDFILDVALARIPGYAEDFMVGDAPPIQISDGRVTIWDLADLGESGGGVVTPLTSDTEIFASSTSASDTVAIVVVQGLDVNSDRQATLTVLTGQSQVSVGNFTHVQSGTIIVTDALGDVFIAEADTVTAGVPDTPSKIKSKIPLGTNITHNGFYKVPNGCGAISMALRATTDGDKDSKIETFITLDGQPTIMSVTYDVQGSINWAFPAPVATINVLGVVLPPKTFLEMRESVSTNSTRTFFGTDFFIVDINQYNLALLP